MAVSRDLRGIEDPASAPISYVTTAPPPGRTVAALCEAIWEAEARLGLLDWEVDGVKPWQANRFGVYKTLVTRLALFERVPESPPQSPWGRLRFWRRILHGTLTCSPFQGEQTFDALVFESERAEIRDGSSSCPYTSGLVRRLRQEGKTVQMIDPHADGTHRKEADPFRRFNDAIALESALRFRTSGWRARSRDVRFVTAIEEHFATTMVGRVSLGWLLSPGIPRFLAARATYRRLLEKRQPSEIFCVCAYGGLAALVAAAHEMSIPVSEVQHGMLDGLHLGYRYPVLPRTGHLDYFPDRFFAWELKTNQAGPMPCEIDLIPFPQAERLHRLRATAVKEANLVIVLSQPTVAGMMVKALIDRRHALAGFRLVIKLHPIELEDPRRRNVYLPLAGEGNISFDESGDLHNLLSRAEYQIGVYSSALFEGIELGCRTLLLPLPGIEHMERLLKSNQAVLIDEFLSKRALA